MTLDVPVNQRHVPQTASPAALLGSPPLLTSPGIPVQLWVGSIRVVCIAVGIGATDNCAAAGWPQSCRSDWLRCGDLQADKACGGGRGRHRVMVAAVLPLSAG